MPQQEIDDYLSRLDDAKRSTLEELRRTILSIIPDAEQGLSYCLPAFFLHGKVVAGFAAFKNHLSYLPHSGSVLSRLSEELMGYTQTKGSLHFPIDHPLPKSLVKKLLDVRIDDILNRQGARR